MGLVSAKCTNCGANIKIDKTKEAGICEHCGSAFITEKAINNYTTNITNNVTNNIENAVIINNSEDKFEIEKKQCKILLMQLENLDFSDIKNTALKVLEVNPDNDLARMLYNCDFKKISHIGGDFASLAFRVVPISKYFKEKKGKIDKDFSLFILSLLLFLENGTSGEVGCLVDLTLDNVESLNLKEDELEEFYKKVVDIAYDDTREKELKNISKKFKKLAWGNVLVGGSAYTSTNINSYSIEAKSMIEVLEKIQNIIKENILEHISNLDFSDEIRSEILEPFRGEEDEEESNNMLSKTGSIIIVMIVVILFIIGLILI